MEVMKVGAGGLLAVEDGPFETMMSAGGSKGCVLQVEAEVEGVRGNDPVDQKKLKQWRKLKHKRYHIPLEGSRIFIRVWQQVNGWENELGMF